MKLMLVMEEEAIRAGCWKEWAEDGWRFIVDDGDPTVNLERLKQAALYMFECEANGAEYEFVHPRGIPILRLSLPPDLTR